MQLQATYYDGRVWHGETALPPERAHELSAALASLERDAVSYRATDRDRTIVEWVRGPKGWTKVQLT